MTVNLSFEKAVKQLEDTVKELETGDLSLEKALKKFEEGIKLSKYCSKKLDETEQRVAILLKDQKENITEKPFNYDSETD